MRLLLSGRLPKGTRKTLYIYKIRSPWIRPREVSDNLAPRPVGLVYWGLTPQQQPGSYQGGEMMMKSVFWWRKPEYPEETTDLRQVYYCLLLFLIINNNKPRPIYIILIYTIS